MARGHQPAHHARPREGLRRTQAAACRPERHRAPPGRAENPRDLEIPGRDLKGVHFAMTFLEIVVRCSQFMIRLS